ncbi:MAG: thiamine-phosphate synthase family protein, partial [Methanothrix sp.]|nr:thiamine-phosphate synthase family protein [Methanothrix sp.]
MYRFAIMTSETYIMNLDEEIEMYGQISLALNIIEGCSEFAALIPEVRANLVYARPYARSREHVLGIDGRITVVNGMPHAAGKPRFGASSHMARL